MMRVCHLDTCPVGVATQNPVLRERFSGKPEFVVNFFEFIAQEVREIMAELGFRTIEEMVGRSDALDTAQAVDHWKARGLDLSAILEPARNPYGQTLHHSVAQDHGLDEALDLRLIEQSRSAIEERRPVRLSSTIGNTNRTVGTMLGYEVTKKWAGEGLPDDTISIDFSGSAGQSFGAFVPRGITLRLTGDANDYVGKGLSGGRIVVRPDSRSTFVAHENVIAGNVIGYGATSGEIYLRGVVGERFCVRNSGATAVVEGVGDHGCEYMTGGRVVVLGSTGRNFAAGMSGGVAYVYDPTGIFPSKVNYEMVDLEKLSSADEEELVAILQRHLAETESDVAQRVLEQWEREKSSFMKVMPRDYRRVLEVIDAARAEGLSEQEMLDRVMEAARG
jgi:glutamate synthase (NADPH/NADH) large chain